MNRHVIGWVLASAVALTATLAAQYPQTPQRPTRTPGAQDQARMVTVEGCLMREADVPGRRPNIAERAGIAEDYILTSTKMIKGSAPGSGTPQARPGETPTGTAGTRAAMYEVEGIDDEELKQHAGRRVQLDGVFENVDQARDRPEAGTPADDLPEIRASAIRPVAGECPPKQ